MTTRFEVNYKYHATQQLSNADPREVGQIYKKVALLANNPEPDSKNKKIIKGDYVKSGGKTYSVYRIRSGDFRVVYTFIKQTIYILTIDRRPDAYKSRVKFEEPDSKTMDIELIQTASEDEAENESYQPLNKEINN